MRDIQYVVLYVFADDEPAPFRGVALSASEIQPPALAERIIHQSDMLPDLFPRERADLAGAGGQIAFEKISEIPFADKADARAVLLFGGRKPVLLRDGAHLRLFHPPERKKHALELRLRHLIEKVGLILVRVRRLQEKMQPVLVQDVAVMPRGDEIGAERLCIVAEGAELYFPVAQHVRVGRPALFVFFEEMRKHPFAVFLCEIDGIIRDADRVAHALHVFVVRFGGAAAVLPFLFPIYHVQTDHVVSLFLQQERGDRAVHAAAHADDASAFVSHNLFSRDFSSIIPR